MKAPRRFGNLDSANNARNIEERGIDFADAGEFDFSTAVISKTTDAITGNVAPSGLGSIRGRLHVLVFTMRGETCHVISLRKANRREIKRYVEES